MDEGYFIPYLKELAAKYSVADDLNVTLDRGRIIIDCSKGKFAFVYDFALLKEGREGCTVPLLHWRSKRRSVELRNIVKTGMVEKPLAMRIHHIVPRREFDSSLQDILAYETDLAEFITGQKVDRIFADFSGMEAIVDMAINQFGIESDADKQKMRILFNAYVGQYIASCFPLGGI